VPWHLAKKEPTGRPIGAKIGVSYVEKGTPEIISRLQRWLSGTFWCKKALEKTATDFALPIELHHNSSNG